MKRTNSADKGLITLIVILAVLSLVIFFAAEVFNGSLGQSAETGLLTANKYAGALKRVEQLLASYQTDLFGKKPFVQLKSFISLPLKIGQVGKANPFELPPSPEELLLEGLINLNR